MTKSAFQSASPLPGADAEIGADVGDAVHHRPRLTGASAAVASDESESMTTSSSTSVPV